MVSPVIFAQDCKCCPRLDEFLCRVKQNHPDYYAQPVAPFGDADARLLIVGLAPGMHGANATGRPFTGDYAGLLLYQALYEFGYSNRPVSEALNDGLILNGCRITNAVKCLPPQNKPTTDEIEQCNSYLSAELNSLPEGAVILALGRIAHQAILKAYGMKLSRFRFALNVSHDLPEGLTLLDSYHSSRYNVQTKRLTKEMFYDVFLTVRRLLDAVI
ncbi:MAG: uracil-DNA glycosylase [Methylosarcina sp.]